MTTTTFTVSWASLSSFLNIFLRKSKSLELLVFTRKSSTVYVYLRRESCWGEKFSRVCFREKCVIQGAKYSFFEKRFRLVYWLAGVCCFFFKLPAVINQKFLAFVNLMFKYLEFNFRLPATLVSIYEILQIHKLCKSLSLHKKSRHLQHFLLVTKDWICEKFLFDSPEIFLMGLHDSEMTRQTDPRWILRSESDPSEASPPIVCDEMKMAKSPMGAFIQHRLRIRLM